MIAVDSNGPLALLVDDLSYMIWDRFSEDLKRVNEPTNLSKIVHRIEHGKLLQLSETIQPTRPITPPPDWDPENIEGAEENLNTDDFGVPRARALFLHTDLTTLLIKSEGNYLLWDNYVEAVFCIDEPKGCKTIIEALKDRKTMEFTELEAPFDGLEPHIPAGWTDKDLDNIASKIPHEAYNLSKLVPIIADYGGKQILVRCDDEVLLWKDSGDMFRFKGVDYLEDITYDLNS
ncbi:MAG: hypothetical protein MMC23_005627 [Stictis urceolatum]|nr:hypothetical protein [Stictis urceolata]